MEKLEKIVNSRLVKILKLYTIIALLFLPVYIFNAYIKACCCSYASLVQIYYKILLFILKFPIFCLSLLCDRASSDGLPSLSRDCFIFWFEEIMLQTLLFIIVYIPSFYFLTRWFKWPLNKSFLVFNKQSKLSIILHVVYLINVIFILIAPVLLKVIVERDNGSQFYYCGRGVY